MSEDLNNDVNIVPPETDPFTEPTPSAVDTLVGDGRKFNDIEALARGKLESDSFIEKLQGEMSELREELLKKKSAEEVYSKIKEEISKTRTTSHGVDSVPAGTPAATENTMPDLGELVAKEIAKLKQADVSEANVKAAVSKLGEMVGPDRVQTAIAERAGQLGVGADFLRDTAKTSPDAFLAFFAGSTATTTATPVDSTVNLAAMGSQRVSPVQAEITKLEEMRVSDRDTFYSANVQNRLMALYAQLN